MYAAADSPMVYQDQYGFPAFNPASDPYLEAKKKQAVDEFLQSHAKSEAARMFTDLETRKVERNVRATTIDWQKQAVVGLLVVVGAWLIIKKA